IREKEELRSQTIRLDHYYSIKEKAEENLHKIAKGEMPESILEYNQTKLKAIQWAIDNIDTVVKEGEITCPYGSHNIV
ncbi:MAG: hypothetical protein QNL04_06580, partial [SAR324 cluster bacterium]|nr:hypothetical protein [SAR324 cluster bacterium]